MVNRYRMLIAVEHDSLVEKLHEIETEHLFIMEVVHDRETILNRLSSEYYDILLLDDQIDNIRTANMVKFCHKHLHNVLTIVIAQNSNIDKAVMMIKAGAFHYLESPMLASKLEQTLHNAIAKIEQNSNIKTRLENELNSKKELFKKEYVEHKIRSLELLQIQTQFGEALTDINILRSDLKAIDGEGDPTVFISDEDDISTSDSYDPKVFSNSETSDNEHDILQKNNNLNPLPDYNYLRTLGAGNMGVVLLVEKDDQKFALKILNGQLQHSQKTTFIKRFLREAKVLSNFQHPNLIQIYEYGFHENSNIPFILMEYIESETLAESIKRNNLSIEQRIFIITQLAAVLTVIHAQNIIHRDIKPGNILVCDDFQIKLTDFGIAKDENSLMTREHEILGSPAYMPPEVFISSSKSSEQFDIFSLGVVSYELLTGKKPFKGRNISELKYNIKNLRPLEPRKINPQISEDLQNILSRTLRKRPEDRYQSSDELFNDLNNLGKKELTFSGSLLRNLVHKAIRHWA